MGKFYYLTVSYCISALCLNESSYLQGPYDTEEARQAALDTELDGRDLETEEIVNVTLLKLTEDGLISERSYLAGDDCEDDDDEDDSDDEDED